MVRHSRKAKGVTARSGDALEAAGELSAKLRLVATLSAALVSATLDALRAFRPGLDLVHVLLLFRNLRDP